MKPSATFALVASAFTLGLSLGHQDPAQDKPKPKDNEELVQIYKEDQQVRSGDIDNLDWNKIATLDRQHRIRVTEMLKAGEVQTGADYYHAAMVFQHATEKQGYKLAHELAVIAATKGEERGKWLAAASWDRFLRAVNENQRFGTQYTRDSGETSFKLAETDPEVTDAMRKAMNCPTLEEAKARAKDFNTP